MSTFFRVQSLADIVRDKGAWPSQQDFVSPILTSLISPCCLEDRHNGRVCCTTRQLRSSSNLARYTWSYRLGVIIETLFHILDTAVVKKCLVPLSPRSALLRVVWTPILPNKPRPMTIHSQSVDGGGQILEYMKYNNHLQTILLPVLQICSSDSPFVFCQFARASGS